MRIEAWGSYGTCTRSPSEYCWRPLAIVYIASLSLARTVSHLLMTTHSIYACERQSLQSCLTLCDAMDYSLPGSSVHRILQTRRLEWVATSPSNRSSWFRDQTQVSYVSWIGRRVLYCHQHLRSLDDNIFYLQDGDKSWVIWSCRKISCFLVW